MSAHDKSSTQRDAREGSDKRIPQCTRSINPDGGERGPCCQKKMENRSCWPSKLMRFPHIRMGGMSQRARYFPWLFGCERKLFKWPGRFSTRWGEKKQNKGNEIASNLLTMKRITASSSFLCELFGSRTNRLAIGFAQIHRHFPPPLHPLLFFFKQQFRAATLLFRSHFSSRSVVRFANWKFVQQFFNVRCLHVDNKPTAHVHHWPFPSHSIISFLKLPLFERPYVSPCA